LSVNRKHIAMFQNYMRIIILAIVTVFFPVLVAAQEAETTVAPDAPALVEGITSRPETQTEVQVGAFILRLRNVSPRDASYDVDMWMWFRWSGSEIRPDLTFELANGIITNTPVSQVEEDMGMNYATMRVQATIFHDFDVRRFPMDDHQITIQIEDSQLDEASLIYVADVEATAIDPQVAVPGWDVIKQEPFVESHVYNTSYGLRSSDTNTATYSRMTIPIDLERTGFGTLFKSFWVSLLAVILGLLAFLVKSDDLDARFGMGVGSIFAASANAFILSDTLPQTNFITLAEQVNLIAVGIIFMSVFISIWSLRLRYVGRDDDSLRLDRNALIVFAAVYVILNLIVMNFDLSGAPPIEAT
jgi:hypothetical protein